MLTYEEASNIVAHWSNVQYHVKGLESLIEHGPWIEYIESQIMGPADTDLCKLRKYLQFVGENEPKLRTNVERAIGDICDIAGLDAQDYIV